MKHWHIVLGILLSICSCNNKDKEALIVREDKEAKKCCRVYGPIVRELPHF